MSFPQPTARNAQQVSQVKDFQATSGVGFSAIHHWIKSKRSYSIDWEVAILSLALLLIAVWFKFLDEKANSQNLPSRDGRSDGVEDLPFSEPSQSQLRRGLRIPVDQRLPERSRQNSV